MSVKTRLWILGTVVVCGGLILLGVVVGLLPQMTTASSTEGLAQSTEEQNDIQRGQLAKLQNAKQNGDELAAELSELRAALPDTSGSPAWVSELRAIEKSSKAVVTEFKLPNPLDQAAAQGNPDAEATAGPQRIPFTMKVEGSSLTRVADFLRELQAGDRLVLVQTAKITVGEAQATGAQTDAEASEVWTAEISGQMYAELDG